MDNPFSIVRLLLRIRRPSRLADMPAVKDAFWLGKGYDALTFFGTIITHTHEAADHFNRHYDTMKNHEMIHLRQAQNCHDSWLRFYVLYLWYCLRTLPYNRRLRGAAYRLNPFEMEAYAMMHDLDYPDRCSRHGADGWRRYARMKPSERHQLWTDRMCGRTAI